MLVCRLPADGQGYLSSLRMDSYDWAPSVLLLINSTSDSGSAVQSAKIGFVRIRRETWMRTQRAHGRAKRPGSPATTRPPPDSRAISAAPISGVTTTGLIRTRFAIRRPSAKKPGVALDRKVSHAPGPSTFAVKTSISLPSSTTARAKPRTEVCKGLVPRL
jgi:hypothetical protein